MCAPHEARVFLPRSPVSSSLQVSGRLALLITGAVYSSRVMFSSERVLALHATRRLSGFMWSQSVQVGTAGHHFRSLALKSPRSVPCRRNIDRCHAIARFLSSSPSLSLSFIFLLSTQICKSYIIHFTAPLLSHLCSPLDLDSGHLGHNQLLTASNKYKLNSSTWC